MPKTFVAQNVAKVNPIHFETKGDVVVGLKCNCEVNYGEIGLNHEVDIWADLNTTQRTKAQQLYDLLKAKVETVIMEGN